MCASNFEGLFFFSTQLLRVVKLDRWVVMKRTGFGGM